MNHNEILDINTSPFHLHSVKNLTLIRIGVHIAHSYDGKSDIFLIQEASPTLLICHGAFPRTQTRQNGSERRCGRWVSLLPILFTSHSALGFY